ncbi:MAG: class I SAM-dependent methyltransferase [Caldilineaceae bacterium]
MAALDSTQRFSNRVENYVKYRPRYPAAIVDFLGDAIGLTAETTVADVGSGTGFLAELFLQNGNCVVGVEPNAEMRTAGDDYLRKFPRFSSVDGTSEATTLADQSVDLIVAGQAFHWFEPLQTRAEFARMLRSGGHVALVWNSRRLDVPFMQEYEEILHKFTDNYGGVSERNILDENIAAFFAPQPMQLQMFDNVQVFDFDGVKGRALSSSYAPAPGRPLHEPFVAALADLFARFEENNRVQIQYVTRLYWGQL